MDSQVLERRTQQVLYDKKWTKLLRRAWPWRHIPFVEFVLVAGSMATGTVHKFSDFDVIVGARQGRIFTARFCTAVFFGTLGWRRKKLSHRDAANDKVCLNHFVTVNAFNLKQPRNASWKKLYQFLVPLYGSVEKANAFFRANESWMGERVYADDMRHIDRAPSRLKILCEKLLRGRAGEWLEKKLKKMQTARVEKSLVHDPPGFEPRIICNNDELEFHPDTAKSY